MSDLKHNRISVTVHAVAAILIGQMSVWLSNNLYSGVLGIGVLIGIGYSLRIVTGKRDLKWWLANGIVIYLLVWLVTWTYLINL